MDIYKCPIFKKIILSFKTGFLHFSPNRTQTKPMKISIGTTAAGGCYDAKRQYRLRLCRI